MKYTTIVHEARKQLDLSLTDYCIASLIFYYSNNPRNQVPGWCLASKQLIATTIGITKSWVVKSISVLEEKGLVEKSGDGRLLRTTQKWYNATVIDYTSGVENTPIGEESTPGSVNKLHQNGVENTPPSYNKEIKKEKVLSVDDRKKEFYNSLVPYVTKYGKEMIRAFYEFWSETNENGKMRWEITKRKGGVFEVGKRLATWKKRDEDFKTPFKKPEQSDKASLPSTYRPA